MVRTVALGCLIGVSAFAQAGDVLSPPVCYRLELSSWKLVDPKGKPVLNAPIHPEPWWQPPASILLDANPPTPEEKQKGIDWLNGATHAVRSNGVPSPHWVFDV